MPVWRDSDEAAIALCYSVHHQHQESKVIFAILSNDMQKVQLVTAGNMVFARIHWDKPLDASFATEERITYPIGTKIKLEIFHNFLIETTAATGFVVNNLLLPFCHVRWGSYILRQTCFGIGTEFITVRGKLYIWKRFLPVSRPVERRPAGVH